MAIDLGRKRVGVALSDEQAFMCIDALAFTVRDDRDLIRQVEKLVDEREVAEIVVGHPINLNGERTETTRWAERIYTILKERYHFPVNLLDERMTTALAERFVPLKERKKDKSKVDAVAASLLLADYLRMRENTPRNTRTPSGHSHNKPEHTLRSQGDNTRNTSRNASCNTPDDRDEPDA
jgi:putative Holliday junction resolvase